MRGGGGGGAGDGGRASRAQRGTANGLCGVGMKVEALSGARFKGQDPRIWGLAGTGMGVGIWE